MKMRLTNREKTLLVVLGVIGGMIACYMFVITPTLNRVKAVENIRNEKLVEYNEFKAMISTDNPVYSKMRVMDNKVKNVTALFFPSINQDKIITILDANFAESGINPESIVFSDMDDGSSAVQPAASVPAASPENKENRLESVKDSYYGIHKDPVKPVSVASASAKLASNVALEGVQRLSTTISFKSGYDGVAKFMALLEAGKRRVVIDNMTSVKGEDDTITTMKVSFYAMPKIHMQDSDYFAWDYMNPYGKDNPFSPYSGYTKKVTAVASAGISSSPVKAASPLSDFGMMVNPIASDLTTVLMSRMGDSSRQTYVYGDNKNFEAVQLEFVQKSGKYYYRYRTQTDSYPKKYDEMVEFIPKGNNIKMDIFSSLRKGAGDLSGATITLSNKTNLKVVVNVKGDDPGSPRVRFASKSGDVQINKYQ